MDFAVKHFTVAPTLLPQAQVQLEESANDRSKPEVLISRVLNHLEDIRSVKVLNSTLSPTNAMLHL